MQRISGWLLCGVVARLLMPVSPYAHMPLYCHEYLFPFLSGQKPSAPVLSLLVNKVNEAIREYHREILNNIINQCQFQPIAGELCVPAQSADCDLIRSACALTEYMKKLMHFLKFDLPHDKLWKAIDCLRREFRLDLIPGEDCEKLSLKLTEPNDTFGSKCVGNQTLETLHQWLLHYPQQNNAEAVLKKR